MNIPERTRFIGDEDPLQVWWSVNGSLVNFASGYTFSVKLARDTDATSLVFTKTSGVTGAAGSGVEGNGTPNLTVAWASSGELNSVTAAGRYLLEIVATKTADGSQTTMWLALNMMARLG